MREPRDTLGMMVVRRVPDAQAWGALAVQRMHQIGAAADNLAIVAQSMGDLKRAERLYRDAIASESK